MQVHISSSSLKQTRWYEYLVRFFFGGAITVAAGLIARTYGPAIGGLFLAFPAIFPAAASLVERHEIERKHAHGMHGTHRGHQAAALEARGTALGSIGLVLFAGVVTSFGEDEHWQLTLFAALTVWAVASIIAWKINRTLRAPRRVRHDASEHKHAA